MLAEEECMPVDQRMHVDQEPCLTDREGVEQRNANASEMDIDDEQDSPRRGEEERNLIEDDSEDSEQPELEEDSPRQAKEKEGDSVGDEENGSEDSQRPEPEDASEDGTDCEDESDNIITPIHAQARGKQKGKMPEKKQRQGRAPQAPKKPPPRARPKKLPQTVEGCPPPAEDRPAPAEEWGTTGLPQLALEAYTPLMTGSMKVDIPGAQSIAIQAHHQSQLEFLESIIQAARTTASEGCYPSRVKVFQDEQVMTRQDWQCYRTHSIHVLGSRTADISSQEDRMRRFEAEVRKIRYGDLSQRFEVQDLSIDLAEDGCLAQYREATLRQLVDIAKQKEGKAVNTLDIPGTRDTFDYPELSSERVAWDLMTDHKEEYPVAAMRWWLISTGWAHHMIHQDCNGLGTIIHVKTGMKILMIVTPKCEQSDPGSIYRLCRKFQLDRVDTKEFYVEIVVLRPGDKLFLRPRTLHAVITPEPTVVVGGHLYSTLTIKETVWGIYDDFIAGKFFTNTEHRKAPLAVLSCLVNLWYENLVNSLPSDRMETLNGHLPELTDPEQFKDFLEFTTLLELYSVLCKWTYDSRDYQRSAVMERQQVIRNRKRARQLLEWFFCTYQVLDRQTGIEYLRSQVENHFVANQASPGL
ncbi:hypothetical protein H0H87_007051 [Tephrocybe sp. NHM501043]|nr:hypothetical protein H0H87_007051 [Tephrocybe sp. NHM501043]